MFQAFLFLEASRRAFLSQRRFVKHTLPRLRRKAAEAAEAAQIPRTSHSPDLSAAAPDGGDAGRPADAAAFDFAEVDRDIAADAHEVDETGKAEQASLPPTPQSEDVDLPPDSEFDDSSFSYGETQSQESSTPSGGTPLNGTPLHGSPALGGPEPKTPVQRARVLEEKARQSPPDERGTGTSPSAGSRRRSYTTMNGPPRSDSQNPVSAPSSEFSSPTQRNRAATVTAPSSRSAGSSPRSSLIPLTSRESGIRARRLHSRTNSHPEFQALMKSVLAAEDQSSASWRLKTRVWPADRSGSSTPLEPLVEDHNPYEEALRRAS